MAASTIVSVLTRSFPGSNMTSISDMNIRWTVDFVQMKDRPFLGIYVGVNIAQLLIIIS
jgi:hypothetical protein